MPFIQKSAINDKPCQLPIYIQPKSIIHNSSINPYRTLSKKSHPPFTASSSSATPQSPP